MSFVNLIPRQRHCGSVNIFLVFFFFFNWLLFSFDNEVCNVLWNWEWEIKLSGWFVWSWGSLIPLFGLELAVTDSGFGIHTRHRCTLVAYLCLFSVMEWLPGGCNEQEGRERLSESVFQSQVQRKRERDLMDGGMMVGMKWDRQRGGMEWRKEQQVERWGGVEGKGRDFG